MIINFLLSNLKLGQETISNKIIRELEKARYSIWLANVWFSDDDVFNLLLKKLDEGLNVEVVLKTCQMTVYEHAKIQKFIDLGGEIFIINELEACKKDKFCIVDYSTIINNNFQSEQRLKPTQGSIFLKETQETLVEQYISQYLHLKNNYCINRY